MNPRLTHPIAAVTLAVLACATGCTSTPTVASKPNAAGAKPSSTPAATPSIPAVTLNAYFHNLRNPSAGGGGDDQRLAAGHTPDSVLVTAGAVACSALHRGDSGSEAATLVQKAGGDETDALDIVLAAGVSRLCTALG